MREAEIGGKIVVRVDGDLEELIPEFLAVRRQNIRSMLEALARDDYETIRVLGHRMNGSGGGYGFDAITHIGRSLEQTARNRDPEKIRTLVDELAAYLESVEIVYQ
jgi:HPt (histidine-containing phosphotransfer) domain-containing protein